MISGLGLIIDYTKRSDYTKNIKKADEALKYFYSVYKTFDSKMSYEDLKNYFLNLNPGFMYYLGFDSIIAEGAGTNIKTTMEKLANSSKGNLPLTSKDTQAFNQAYQADVSNVVKLWGRSVVKGVVKTIDQASNLLKFGIIPLLILGAGAYGYFMFVRPFRSKKNPSLNLIFKGKK